MQKMLDSTEPTKRCSRCKVALPLESFDRRSASADGRQNYCRECLAAWVREHRPRKLAEPPGVPPGHKWCRACATTKDLSAFARNRAAKGGYQAHCRECQASKYRAKQTARGKIVRPLAIPDGYKFCRACQRLKALSEWNRSSRATDGLQTRCRDCAKADNRRRYFEKSYGLSSAEVDALRDSQGGLCAICRSAPAVHVDHDHQTGEVRGMCCFSCNAALGHFRDDPLILRRAARYLEGRGPRRARRTAHKHGLTYELLLPADELAPRPGEGVFEGWLRAMLAVSGSRVEHIRFGTEAAASDATEGTP